MNMFWKSAFLIVAALLLSLIASCNQISNNKTSDSNNHIEQSITEDGRDLKFEEFLKSFLDDCYWQSEDIMQLIVDKSPKLKPYTDPRVEIRRYFAPGAFAILYSRTENFGLVDNPDFVWTAPKHKGSFAIQNFNKNEQSVCELDFDSRDVVYYNNIINIPDEVVFKSDNYETHKVETIPYPNSKIMAVYAKDMYSTRGFYFIYTPNKKWVLAFVDDSLCSA